MSDCVAGKTLVVGDDLQCSNVHAMYLIQTQWTPSTTSRQAKWLSAMCDNEHMTSHT